MILDVFDGAEEHPDIVGMMKIMPICSNLNKLPSEVEGRREFAISLLGRRIITIREQGGEDTWTQDFLRSFYKAQNIRMKREQDKERFKHGN